MDAAKTTLKMNATFASVASISSAFQRVMHRKTGLLVLDTLLSWNECLHKPETVNDC